MHERFEAIADSAVEVGQSLSVERVRDNSGGVKQLTEGRAVAEEQERHLGIRKFPELLEEACCFFYPSLRVAVAKLLGSHWAPQQFKASVVAEDDV